MRLYLTFSQISLYLSNNSSSFIKKDINLVSSKSFLYAVTFRRNIHKDLSFLASWQLMNYLHPFWPKETLLDIAILLICIFFIVIGSLCWWNFCFLISISPNFRIFSIFIYAFKNLYNFEIHNFPLFSYVSGSNLESSKKLLTLHEIKLFLPHA